MSDVGTLKDRNREWIARNPLRAWRHRYGLSMMDGAVALGIGLSSVQSWEAGAHFPTDESMQTIAGVIGEDPDRLARKWRSWYEARPTVTR